MIIIPKLVYQSSPRLEACLKAWESFFQKNKLRYRTDRLLYKGILNDHNISVIFGSWKNRPDVHHQVKNRVVSSGKPFVVHETSLLGREKVTYMFDEPWFRIGVNGFLADTGLFNNAHAESNRWMMIQKERNIEVKPWEAKGSFVLVVLQLPGDASLRGASIEKWALDMCKLIRASTDFPIVIRRPQLDVSFDPIALEACASLVNVEIQNGTRENLYSMIDQCLFACTYTSGMGIDLILRGKPVVVGDSGSFVFSVRTDLPKALEGKYNTPDRLPLLSELAYCQWHLREIESGEVWNHLHKLIEKSLVA